MLQKIVAIKNVGRFLNSAAPGNPEFGKHTLVWGANGYGKSTLCAILRSLQTGEAHHVTGRKALGVRDPLSVEVLLKDLGHTSFDGVRWTGTFPEIAIFDSVFVHENVHSGDVVDVNHRRNFYRVLVGREGVRLAEEEARVGVDARAATQAVTAAENALQPHVPRGIRLPDFRKLQANPNIDVAIAEQAATLDAANQAHAIATRRLLDLITPPALPADFDALLGKTIVGVERDVEETLRRHIAQHDMGQKGEAWLLEGQSYQTRDDCPYCGRHGLSALPLIAAFKGIFSDAYTTLKNDLLKAQGTIAAGFGDGAIGTLTTTIERNKAAIEFWQRFCPIDAAARDVPAGFIGALRAFGAAASSLIGRKIATPLEPIVPDQAFMAARDAYKAACDELATCNDGLTKANGLINAQKTSTAQTDPKAAEERLTVLKATKTRHEPAINALCVRYREAEDRKAALEKRKIEVRDALERHCKTVVGPYQTRINELLETFNAEFSIARTGHNYAGGQATSNYQLVINRTPVNLGDERTPKSEPSFTNTLSAGDKATLALAFFLAALEQDPECAKKIVVFDDPFNSQDAFRRSQTLFEIRRISERCAQVVVMSHDPRFLLSYWEKCPAADRRAIHVDFTQSLGSKLRPIELDKACQGRLANEMDDLISFCKLGAGNLVDIVKKMRVVLESHCRLTYPGFFLQDDNLGVIVQKVREVGDTHPAWPLVDSLERTNDYSKGYHHGAQQAGDDLPPLDATELRGYVRTTLKLVNATIA